jgi:hypothetical protein
MNELKQMTPARRHVTALLALIILAGCRGPAYLVPSASTQQSESNVNPAAVGETTMKHVLTGDYFGSIFSNPRLRGSRKVPPSEAAKFLDYADVVPSDQQTTEDAGMKTLFYYRPTFQGRDEPFYQSGQFAHSCSGHRIVIYKRSHGHPLFLMSRSGKLAHLAADYIDQILKQNAFDLVFEDDAGFAPYQLGIHPCNVSASEWIARDAQLEKTVHAKQLPSSLNAFTENDQHVWTNNQQSVDLALHHEGGLMEQCYSSNSNPGVLYISDSLWIAQENTEITIVGGKRLFFCYVRNYDHAKDKIATRLYDYASFLLTYKPAYAVLWETYATPSDFHVFPESGVVALNPKTQEPNDISQLKSGGVYVREFANCYYRGSHIGACAAIVNPSSTTASINPLFGKYKHSLVLGGGGVTDGGTIKFTGSPPPKRISKDVGYIALAR